MLISYSTVAGLLRCKYSWICKQQDLPTEDFKWFGDGKKMHRRIQDHVSGREIDAKLIKNGLDPDKWYFPIVEEVDRDENCHFEFELDGHTIHGYFDGLYPEKRLLEIKTGNYSPRDFLKSFQRKIYVTALNVPESVLIHAKDANSRITTTIIKTTEKDKEDALKWLREGIKIIESGDFEPEEDRFCGRCIYKNSCDKAK